MSSENRVVTVLVDDCRDMDVDVIIRKPHNAVHYLNMIQPAILYMDHDMGPGPNGYKILTEYLEGLEIGMCTIWPVEIVLVTANPVGRRNMELALEHHGYHLVRGRWMRNPL